ncbi:MAG: HD domain-containing protein [Deltaproteobacteria bacterium]|nr:HD domain-containing protein [Deltaproteobacteria bacterium]
MTRTSDLIREKPEEKQNPVRFSDIDELRSGADRGTVLSEQANIQVQKDKADADKTYRSLQDFILDVKNRVVQNQTIQLADAFLSINRVIESKGVLERMYQLTITYGHGEDYSISHPVNVMIYALKMGIRLGYSRVKLNELALASLLYDVGMFMIPDSVITKKDPFSESELSLIKRHPEMGKNILYVFKDDCPWLYRTAHEHHERENGQGYPQGLKGDDIDEYAKIVGICDSYEAMTHDRPHKKAIMQFASVRELVETKNQMFSHKILKEFLEEISLYPIGSYVKLNNKAIGRVIATNADQPLKPIISILFDGHGDRITDDRTINLKENPVLVITGGAQENEFPQFK